MNNFEVEDARREMGLGHCRFSPQRYTDIIYKYISRIAIITIIAQILLMGYK